MRTLYVIKTLRAQSAHCCSYVLTTVFFPHQSYFDAVRFETQKHKPNTACVYQSVQETLPAMCSPEGWRGVKVWGISTGFKHIHLIQANIPTTLHKYVWTTSVALRRQQTCTGRRISNDDGMCMRQHYTSSALFLLHMFGDCVEFCKRVKRDKLFPCQGQHKWGFLLQQSSEVLCLSIHLLKKKRIKSNFSQNQMLKIVVKGAQLEFS